MKKKKVYALYKGDEFLEIGTYEELAKYLGVSKRTIQFYLSPSNKKRDKGNKYVVVKLEEDDNE